MGTVIYHSECLAARDMNRAVRCVDAAADGRWLCGLHGAAAAVAARRAWTSACRPSAIRFVSRYDERSMQTDTRVECCLAVSLQVLIRDVCCLAMSLQVLIRVVCCVSVSKY